MTKAEEYLNKAKEKYAEGEQHKNIASRCFESCREYKLEYRIESVNRVLDFIRDEYRAGRITEMDTLGRSFVFEGYGREKGINPEYRLFYKVNFDGSDLTLLTPGDGFHSIDLAKNGKYLIDNYSRADQEPIAELRDTKGRKIMELERPDLRLLYEMRW